MILFLMAGAGASCCSGSDDIYEQMAEGIVKDRTDITPQEAGDKLRSAYTVEPVPLVGAFDSNQDEASENVTKQ